MPLKADVLPLKELFIGSSRRPLLIFAGVVGFVLLVACTSIANLFLLRTANRRRELSVRAALGASRRRIARQLVVESLVVSLAGGAGGLLLAVLAVPSLVALAPPGLLPRAEAIRVDVVVLGFALALAATVGIVAALGPALQATRLHRPALGPGRTMTFRHQRLSGALVVAEIALTLVLAMGAALFAGSFLRLRSVDAGFRPDRVMTMTVELPSAAYAATSEMQAFHAQVLARLGEAPGAARAAVVNFLPFGPGLITGDFQVAPPDRAPEGASLSADKLAVSPGYFGTMGIRLLRGRDFTSEDRTGGPGVVIISESVANRVWPGHDPLGRRLSVWGQPDNPQWLTIVGVVDDVRQQRLARAGRPALYQPYTQVTRPFLLRQATFVVRAAGDTAATAAALRAAVRHVDRDQPILFMASMDDMVSVQTALPRFQARVVGVLAIAALVLTLVGVYGVLSSAVTERRREMAIRLAIGARPGNVSRLVIGRSLALTAAGTAIGLAGALALTRTLRQFLFEISPTDPATFAVVTIAVVVAATAAAALPAWRATRVDPIEALRAE
jgi:putative ABC transport system permease protein